MAGTISTDAIEELWWLAWTAFALPHGHNVFAAQWQNYPLGQNFGLQGSMVPLGILFMPITKLFGPIVAWNVAARFALAVSAASMCFVLRRWVTWWPAAFVGGLLYGFSAYALHTGGNYLFLVFVPLPPVFFLLLHEILVRQKWRPFRVGALLGVVCCLQFFIWSEVLAGMVLVGAIATVLFLAVLVVFDRHRLEKIWRYAVSAFAVGGAIGGVLLLAPALYTVFGPQNTHGAPGNAVSGKALPSDLLGLIGPASQWLSTKGLTTMATAHFPYSQGEYIGIPMIVVLVCFAILLRKPKTMLFAGAMALITFMLALGPRLSIDGHETRVPLPGAVLGHVPVLADFTPVRFSLYTALFVAAMFAIGIDQVRRRLNASNRASLLSPRWRTFAVSGVCVAIMAAVVLPLVPAHTQPTTQANVPSFFTSTAVDAIPAESVVLAYPYPDMSGPNPLFFEVSHVIMLDQAISGMRFKLLGGYGWFPSATGHGTTSPAPLRPRSVQQIFDSAYWNASSSKSLLSQTNATADLRAVLAKNKVGAVIVQPQGADTGDVVRYVTGAIGCPVYDPGVAVWLHVRQRLASGAPGENVNACRKPPDGIPHPIVFAKGSTVSGTTILLATATPYLKWTNVSYYLTGGSLHHKLIAQSALASGFPATWDTRTVPNGKYVLRSVAIDTSGTPSTSSRTAITVRN